MNDPDIITWLESPEGERWSRDRNSQGLMNTFVMTKFDDGRWDSILWYG